MRSRQGELDVPVVPEEDGAVIEVALPYLLLVFLQHTLASQRCAAGHCSLPTVLGLANLRHGRQKPSILNHSRLISYV